MFVWRLTEKIVAMGVKDDEMNKEQTSIAREINPIIDW